MDLERYVEEQRERLVRSLADFVAIESVSTSGSDMGPAVAFLGRELEAAGFAYEVVDTPRNPVVIAEAGPADAPLEVLVYGHYDVFPADDPEAWRTPPFEATIEGDRVWGRGTGDNKGQLLAHVHAVRLLRELDGELPVRVKLVVEGEEEIGSRHLPEVARANRDRLRADLCFYSDGPMFPGDHPIVMFGVRGAVVFDLVATGASRQLHSGNFGGVAPTPVMDLCKLLAAMVDEDGEIVVPGVGDGVPPISDAEREAIARLPEPDEQIAAEIGVEPVNVRRGQNAYERLQLRPHFNVCGISAGWAGEGVRPIIANEARAKVDIRLVGDQDPDHVIESIRRFIADQGYDNVHLEQLVGQPASKTSLDHPYVPTVQAAIRDGFGREPLLVPGLGGTTPEYVFTKILGLPTFSVPYAPYDESNHAPNESMKVSLYLGGIKTTASLLRRLAQGAAVDGVLEDDALSKEGAR